MPAYYYSFFCYIGLYNDLFSFFYVHLLLQFKFIISFISKIGKGVFYSHFLQLCVFTQLNGNDKSKDKFAIIYLWFYIISRISPIIISIL